MLRSENGIPYMECEVAAAPDDLKSMSLVARLSSVLSGCERLHGRVSQIEALVDGRAYNISVDDAEDCPRARLTFVETVLRIEKMIVETSASLKNVEDRIG